MIKNIIFDLGGVILDIDYQLMAAAFTKISGQNFVQFYSQKPQVLLFNRFETGKISVEEFRKSVKDLLCINHISDAEFDQAWNAMLLELPPARLNFIRNLRKDYRTFLFSNTNAIHLNYIYTRTLQAISIENFNNCFEKAYYSHELGLRKPDLPAFQALLKENELIANETLFVDDTLSNIEGAQAAGLKTLHLTHFNQLINLAK